MLYLSNLKKSTVQVVVHGHSFVDNLSAMSAVYTLEYSWLPMKFVLWTYYQMQQHIYN